MDLKLNQDLLGTLLIEIKLSSIFNHIFLLIPAKIS